MSDENQIGLAELLKQVKQELLEASVLSSFKEGKDGLLQSTDIPLFAYGNIELELQVTVKKEGSAGVNAGPGLKLFVNVDLKGGGSRDDVQKIKVTLEPLFTKQQLLDILEKQNPKYLESIKRKVPFAAMKGGGGIPDDDE
ncbi:trypco2 family protein [Nodularia sp. LEGE 04288]|uniref:trypco2 family protein n=1 Tax=Nodularia sp. LEGE 04288 TaxID=1828639 RepID=UPI001D116B8B|nr:hypothetical protein [Nodularia sp. LEGE 04288]